MSKLWELVFTRAQRDVLMVMADHADDSGICWPGVPKISYLTDISERQVQRIMRDLEDDRIIERLDDGLGGRKENGRGNTSRYQLRLDRAQKKPPFRYADGSLESNGDTTSPLEVKGDIPRALPAVSEDEKANGDTTSPLPNGDTVTPLGAPNGDVGDTLNGDIHGAKGDIAASPEPPLTEPSDTKDTSAPVVAADFDSSLEAYSERPEVHTLVGLLKLLVERNLDRPLRKWNPAIQKRWMDSCRLLLDRDNISTTEIERVMRWATSDPFWKKNILSFPTFRDHFDRLQLGAQGAQTQGGGSQRRGYVPAEHDYGDTVVR